MGSQIKSLRKYTIVKGQFKMHEISRIRTISVRLRASARSNFGNYPTSPLPYSGIHVCVRLAQAAAGRFHGLRARPARVEGGPAAPAPLPAGRRRGGVAGGFPGGFAVNAAGGSGSLCEN